jgi:hypothetical protein
MEALAMPRFMDLRVRPAHQPGEVPLQLALGGETRDPREIVGGPLVKRVEASRFLDAEPAAGIHLEPS